MGDMQGDAVFRVREQKKKKKKDIHRLHALYARTTDYASVQQPVTNQRSAMAPAPQLAHCNEGTLIRRSRPGIVSSVRCFCDRETRFYHSLSRMRLTLGPSLSTSLCFEPLPEFVLLLPRHDMAENGLWASCCCRNGKLCQNNKPPPLTPCSASIMIGSVCQEPHLVDAKIGSSAGSAHRRSAGL